MLKWQQFLLFFQEVAKQLRKRSREWDRQGSLFRHQTYWGQSLEVCSLPWRKATCFPI